MKVVMCCNDVIKFKLLRKMPLDYAEVQTKVEMKPTSRPWLQLFCNLIV